MAITLSEMMEKAEKKGYKPTSKNTREVQITRPWQENSITHHTQTKEAAITSYPELDTSEMKTENINEKDAIQTVVKPNTNQTQTKNAKEKKVIQTVVKPPPKLHTNQVQSNGNSKTLSLSRLSGAQHQIALFIYKNIIETGGKQTQELSIKHILKATGIKKNTIKTSILRLKKKGYLVLSDYKDGRGGWSQYKLDSRFITDIQRQASDNLSMGLKPYSKPETNAVSSSSFFNNKSTTNELPDEWKNIDTRELQEALNAMREVSGQIFNAAQIKSIFGVQKLTAAQVQKSVEHFTYGIKNYSDQAPYNQMKKPAGFLVSTLKNGDLWDEPRYLSPEERLIGKVYHNLVQELESDKKALFERWIDHETELKREKFRLDLPSNHFLGGNEFKEIAWNYFNHKEWPLIVEKKAIKVLGEEHQALIKKIIGIEICNQ